MKVSSVVKFLILLVLIITVSCKSTSYQGLDDGLYADIQTDKGSIVVQLEYEYSPITVANFVSLAEGNNMYVAEKHKGKPFYNGLKFHRVIKDFMIQGGDPLGTGAGSPGYKFEDESPIIKDSSSAYVFDKAGVMAMANGGPDTNGSQFFITHIKYPSLNGGYTIFGHVVAGQQVVDSIAKDDVMNAIKIIRVGKEAKKFEAHKIFGDYFKRLEAVAKEKLERAAQAKSNFLNDKLVNKAKAETLPSGLKIYFIEKGNGEKPRIGSKVNVHYAGYFATGDLFDTNYKKLAEEYNKFNKRRETMGGYNPKPMDYSPDSRMISGFKEGLQLMRVGDRALLFIPSHLAYGPQGRGSIPPDTDLIFELEITDIVK